MNTPLPPVDETTVRRKRAVRTAWLIAAIAVLVYTAFITYGVMSA